MTKKAVSCGGVVIHHGKILVLYKNLLNKYEGWVLPKGTVEGDEEYTATALREVKEESGVSAKIIKYIGESTYNFCVKQEIILKRYIGILWLQITSPAGLKKRNILKMWDIISIVRHIIYLNFKTRRIFLKRHTENINI